MTPAEKIASLVSQIIALREEYAATDVKRTRAEIVVRIDEKKSEIRSLRSKIWNKDS